MFLAVSALAVQFHRPPESTRDSGVASIAGPTEAAPRARVTINPVIRVFRQAKAGDSRGESRHMLRKGHKSLCDASQGFIAPCQSPLRTLEAGLRPPDRVQSPTSGTGCGGLVTLRMIGGSAIGHPRTEASGHRKSDPSRNGKAAVFPGRQPEFTCSAKTVEQKPAGGEAGPDRSGDGARESPAGKAAARRSVRLETIEINALSGKVTAVCPSEARPGGNMRRRKGTWPRRKQGKSGRNARGLP